MAKDRRTAPQPRRYRRRESDSLRRRAGPWVLALLGSGLGAQLLTWAWGLKANTADFEKHEARLIWQRTADSLIHVAERRNDSVEQADRTAVLLDVQCHLHNGRGCDR